MRSRSIAQALFVSLTTMAALAAGCGQGVGGSEVLGRDRAPIINGTPSNGDDDAAIGIAIMSSGSFQGFCSGVLISENVVLTARHCVSRTADGGIACTKDGKPIGGTGGVLGDHKPGDLQILIGPVAKFSFEAKGIKVFHPDVNNLCNNDIALILLDHKIAGAKLTPIRLDAAPVKGDTVLAVGWGQSNNSSGYGRRRRAGIPITAVGPYSGATVGGAVGSAEFAIGEGICSGDSGGPAFDSKTGAVVGVVSRGGNGAPFDPATDPPTTQCVDSADYKTFNLYTRPDGFKDLIMAAFAEAGTEPWLEGQPDPRKAKFGEACDGPDACRSTLCIAAGGKQFCSQPCGPDVTCPEGYTCQGAGSSSVCAPAPVVEPPAAAPATTSKKGCEVTRVGQFEAGAGPQWLAGLALAIAALRRRRDRVASLTNWRA